MLNTISVYSGIDRIDFQKSKCWKSLKTYSFESFPFPCKETSYLKKNFSQENILKSDYAIQLN